MLLLLWPIHHLWMSRSCMVGKCQWSQVQGSVERWILQIHTSSCDLHVFSGWIPVFNIRFSFSSAGCLRGKFAFFHWNLSGIQIDTDTNCWPAAVKKPAVLLLTGKSYRKWIDMICQQTGANTIHSFKRALLKSINPLPKASSHISHHHTYSISSGPRTACRSLMLLKDATSHFVCLSSFFAALRGFWVPLMLSPSLSSNSPGANLEEYNLLIKLGK